MTQQQQGPGSVYLYESQLNPVAHFTAASPRRPRPRRDVGGMRHCQRAWHACTALRLWLAMVVLTSTPAEKLDGMPNGKGTDAYVGATTGPWTEGPTDSFNVNVSRTAATNDPPNTHPPLPRAYVYTLRSGGWRMVVDSAPIARH